MTVYLIFADSGAFHGSYLDGPTAHRKANRMRGLVAEVPITADYRQSTTRYQRVHECGATYPADAKAPLRCRQCQVEYPELAWQEEQPAEPVGETRR